MVTHQKGLLHLCCFSYKPIYKHEPQDRTASAFSPLGKARETFEMVSALVGFLLHLFIVCIYVYMGVWVCV